MCSEGMLPDGVDPDMAMIILVIQIIFPGIGAMVAGCLAKKGGGTAIVLGILQMLTAIFIVGWIWAIIWGVNLYQKSKGEDQTLPTKQAHVAGSVSPPPPQQPAPVAQPYAPSAPPPPPQQPASIAQPYAPSAPPPPPQQHQPY